MVAAVAGLSEPDDGDRVEAEPFLVAKRPRKRVRPALRRGTILCRPWEQGACVAVSQLYLQRLGRDATALAATMVSHAGVGDGATVSRLADQLEEDAGRLEANARPSFQEFCARHYRRGSGSLG
jgi:hypothetical protein